MLRAGSLNRLVEIQQKGEAYDSLGQPIEGWAKYVKRWANIRTVNGKEYATSDSDRSAVTASIRIRYRDDITAEMRVVYKDTIYNIAAVLPDEAGREYIDLACTTGLNNG